MEYQKPMAYRSDVGISVRQPIKLPTLERDQVVLFVTALNSYGFLNT